MGEKEQSSGRSRIDRLRFCFSELHADALLVTHPANIRYLCGFSGSAGVLLVEQRQATLFTDSRYSFQARDEVSDARVEITRTRILEAVGDTLRRRKDRLVVAYSATHLTVAQRQELQLAAGARARWAKDRNVVERMRAVKDADELVRLQQAAGLISAVFKKNLAGIKPGLTELELAGKIEFTMKRLGASGPSFDTIVASGPRSAWAHAQPTSKPLRRSELVVLDLGAILRGYCSDLTRTVFLGHAPKKIRSLYEAVLEAQGAAKRAIRPGVTAGEVDAAARMTLRRHGFAHYFTHSTGHGLGLEVHEMPRLGRGEKFVLQERMVVTVEPGVYVEGLGGIRIEDDVAVTPGGSVDLTTAPRELIEL